MPKLPASLPQDELNRLADEFLGLSAGDKSVLIGAASVPIADAAMMTATDSANFSLWTRLAALGWMERLELDQPLIQAGFGDRLSKWKLTDLGSAHLPAFFAFADSRAKGEPPATRP